MTGAAFPQSFEEVLGRLEALTSEIRSADPDDLTAIAGLLGHRQRSIAGLAAQLDTRAGVPEPLEAERLQRVFEEGQKAEERLKLVAAGARHQLQELYRAGWHTRALSSDLGPPDGVSSFELEA